MFEEIKSPKLINKNWESATFRAFMKHYICKIDNGHGVQFSHVELPDGQTPLSGFTLDYPKIEVGPEPTAELAWDAWHRKQGELKARFSLFSAL